MKDNVYFLNTMYYLVPSSRKDRTMRNPRPTIKVLFSELDDVADAASIIDKCKVAAREAGWSKDEIDGMVDRMAACTYTRLLRIVCEEFDVE